MPEMTEKDQELLGLLRLNAREPVASLARKLGLSRSTVQDRLRRLEQQGVISGYAVKLGVDTTKSGIGGLITLGVEPRRQIDVGKTIAKIPEVETLYTVSGKYDLVAMVRTPSAEAMDALIDTIGLISGVTDIETSVILSTKVDRR
jgi:DNA-binding Lrp family transcriptional regulator